MGLKGSRLLNPDQLAKYQETHGLSSEQIDQLYQRFLALDRYERGYLTPTDLLRIPQLVQNPLHRQIVDGFFPTRNRTERMNFNQFVEICATFLVPGNVKMCVKRRDGRAEKLRLLSQMIDTHCGDCILRSDFRQAMRAFLTSPTCKNHHIPEVEAELDLLENQAFGIGTDESITYHQFEERVCTADVGTRLSIRKWLDKDDKKRNVKNDISKDFDRNFNKSRKLSQ